MFKVKFGKTIGLLMSSLLLLGLALAPVAPILAAAPEGTAGDPAMLQFTAGGHVLGFAPEAAWLAAGSHALRVGFAGANAVTPASAGSTAASPLGGKGQKGAAPLGRVTYNNLWDGISLTYEAADGAVVKSTYHLAQGADPAQIRLRYNVPVALQADGSLSLAFATGQMIESAPVAWQEIHGRRAPVAVSFQVRGQTVGFSLGAYDPAYPLTIDPEYQWHTFYGGSGVDFAYAIAVDGSGNIYVAGDSTATWAGPAGEPPLHAYSGNHDIVVLKLSSAGAYQWHTFYGATDSDYGNAIAVDGSGNVYVTGYSTATWTGDGGTAPLHAYTSEADFVVLKLSSAGSYQWHTFYGGSEGDYGNGIAVDGSDVYVTGHSYATWNGDGNARPLHDYTGEYRIDIAVLKLSSTGAYQWHTFYGGSGFDYGRAIVVDGSGDVYVTGDSDAAWTGDGGESPLHAYAVGGDIVVLKLSSAGSYRWHTFYAGSLGGYGYAIAVDDYGDIYVGGHSRSWTGDGGALPLHAHTGDRYLDIVVLKLSRAGAYRWHTFYGASDHDHVRGIAVDGRDVYVTGDSLASWTGDGGALPLHGFSENNYLEEIAVLKLSTAGTYQWHTFYGDYSYDKGQGIAVNGSSVYVATYNAFDWTGDDGAPPLHPYASNTDLVVLKLNDTSVESVDDSFSITEDNALSTLDVLANDTTALLIESVGAPAYGSVAISGTTELVYTPANRTASYIDTFDYVASDGVFTETATVSVIVAADNDPIVVLDEAFAVAQNGSLSVPAAGVLANDDDLDENGPGLAATLLGGPDNGAVVLNPDGSFTYTPTPDFAGEDSFTYVASDSVMTATGTVTLNVAGATRVTVDVNDPGVYDFGSICGSITFTDTGSVSVFTVTLSYDYPSVNKDGLPRHYDIEADGSGFNAALTLCYEDNDLLVAGINPAQELALHLYRYSGGGAWAEHSEVDAINNTVTAFEIGEFGVWGFGVSGDRPTALMTNVLIARGGLWATGLVGALGLVILYTRRKRK